jgi:hypothetical protein
MADGDDAEFLEIIGGEMAQYLSPNAILAERRLVLFQPECSQPVRNVHCRSLTKSDR